MVSQPLGSLVCVVFFVTFPSCALGLVWYLIVSIPDLYLLPYIYGYVFLFNCTILGQALDYMMDGPDV